MTSKAHIFILLFLVSTVSFAQVEFTAKASKDKLGLNERLKIVFEMNGNGDDFTPPDFQNFKIFAGPSQSISQSWINGVSKFSKTYTYYLQPEKRGTFTIGQAKVTIDGKEYKTTPITVEVVGAVDQPKDAEDREIRDVTQGIHLVAEVSKTNPYLNEPVSVVYKLYVSPDAAVSNWNFADIPKFSGFWSHDININDYQVKYGSYNGNKDYRYVEIKKTVLYPQKSGELKIEPLTLKVAVDVPTNRRDFFGRTMYETVDKTIVSQSRPIEVKPLPDKNKPANFSGAVGSFQIEAETSKTELEVGESLDYTVSVIGKGNLKLFQIPKVKMPQAFEAYDPEHTEKIATNMGGSSGSISDTYTIVPSSGGNFKIDPIYFAYFDPEQGVYKTIQTQPLTVEVTGSANNLAAVQNPTGNLNAGGQKEMVTAGKQFLYIKLDTRLQDIDKKPFFRSALFWCMLILPILLLPAIIIAGNKGQERAKDFTAKKLKRADKLAKKYLSEARKKLGDQLAYYEALERAMHNYLKAKLNLPTSEMSKDRIEETLMEKGVEKATADEFIALLEACEFARYTPSSDAGMKQDYDKAAQVISKVDKQLKA